MSATEEVGATGPQAEQRVEQLLALNQAAVAITSELDLDSLLQSIVDAARVVVRCKYAALGIMGSDGLIERFPTSGISQTQREKLGAPPRGHGLLGVMLRAGRILRIPDIGADPRRSGFPPHHPPMTSLLGVPIFVQGELMGDLYLTDKLGGPEFSEEDEWLVQLLAIHASTALTNARLHADKTSALQKSSREQARTQALLKVTQLIGRSVQLDEVIRRIVESAVGLLDAAGAAVYLLDRPLGAAADGHVGDEAGFVARYALGLDESASDTFALPLEGSVAGRAVRTGVTQVVIDTAAESGIVLPRLAGGPVRSLVVVPLAISGQALGTLSAYAGRTNGFDDEAVQLLEAFAAVAASAIHNATLYEDARRGREAAEREQQRLREVEQMKDEFLSTAAHELRTPLTTIRMSAGLAHEQMRLLDGAGPVELDRRLVDLIGLVVEGSARMQSLVNDLLDLTRLEQGRTALQTEVLDLRDAVRAAAEPMAPLLEDKDQRLTLRLPETYCWVRGDRQRLEQVFVNLLSNAHKYSPPGSQVEIRVIRSGQDCRVQVRDNGSGVPPEEHERIFERFFRSSVHRNDRTPSTGLGLPIARQIAEMHGGRLWVEPAPGHGSIFILSLPPAE